MIDVTADELARVPVEALDAIIARKEAQADPLGWIGRSAFLWSKQRQIVESVRDNRRTAVQSCHGAGKSFVAARIVAWWIESHAPGEAFAITSAPTARQVRAVLWREITRAHAASRLTGRTNQTEWWLALANGHEEMVAFGNKPADMDPAAFQGIHARYVLVIFDEADGIPKPLWEGAEGLLSNDDARILAIGNPVNPQSEFAENCKPGSGWHVIQISAFDTPNFTGEQVPATLKPNLVGPVWVEEKKRRWGVDNPMYQARVLGKFPKHATDGLIPVDWIRAAQDRTLDAGEPNELGCDVGGGGDESTVCHRRGPVARIVSADRNPDTMQTCGNIVSLLKSTAATVAKVDYVGLGKGVVDRGVELKQPFLGINVGESAADKESYANLKAELYWGLRERFQAGDIDIDEDDEDLAAQLVELKYQRTSRGQLKIESKEDLKKRGKPSPDRADALMIAFARVGPDMPAGAMDIGKKSSTGINRHKRL